MESKSGEFTSPENNPLRDLIQSVYVCNQLTGTCLTARRLENNHAENGLYSTKNFQQNLRCTTSSFLQSPAMYGFQATTPYCNIGQTRARGIKF